MGINNPGTNFIIGGLQAQGANSICNGIDAAATAVVIGGIVVGTAGTTGIYNGYTLAGGDDFNSFPSVVTVTSPTAPYFSSNGYGAGARTYASGGLSQSYDSDPYYTGAQDSHRGVAVGSTNISQGSSILNIQDRIANGTETPYISGRTYVTGMIHTGGYLGVTPPCIIEARVKWPSSPLSGYHPTFWLLNSSPVYVNNTTPALEFDFEPNTYDGSTPAYIQCNYNTHGTVGGGWVSGNGSLNSLFDDTYHICSFVLTASSLQYYIDGALVQTVSHDTTVNGLPYYILFTGHILNPLSPGDWTTAGATGKTWSIDYYRTWIPTSTYASQVIKPVSALPTLQVAYNTSMTYTFPSATAIWGSAISDYVCGIRHEDYEPGNNTEGNSGYLQFPAGLTLTGRVLTGITTDMQPGRIHTAAIPNVSGGSLGYVARGYIDVGPHITTTTLNATNGVAFSYDLYFDCNCGTLVPKTITVSGLPSPFVLTGTVISGTSTTNGTTPITINVTNASGQMATSTVNLVVSASAPSSLAIDGTAANVGSTNPSTVTLSTTKANDIICLFILSGGAVTDSRVSGITDTAGLTWIKRKQVNVGGLPINSLELWYAVSAGILTNDVISVTSTLGGGGTPSIRIEAFAVNGANQTTPFDTNASVPVSVQGTTATSLTATVTTNHANDMLIACVRSLASLGTVTEPSGFTQIIAAGANEDCSYQIVSTIQSATNITYSWTGVTANSSMIVDAIQGT